MNTSQRTYDFQLRESDSLPGAYDVTEAPRKRRKPAVPFWSTAEGREITERVEKLWNSKEI